MRPLIGTIVLIVTLCADAAAGPGLGRHLASPAPPAPRAAMESTISNADTHLSGRGVDEMGREDRDRAAQLKIEHRTFLLGVFTAGIFVLQLFVFGLQARRLRQSIGEASRATRASETAAQAAERTVETMNQTARRELRAYVSLQVTRVAKIDEGQKPEIYISIKNYGQTPAYRFAVTSEIAFASTFAEAHPIQETSLPYGHLAPGAEFSIWTTAPFTLSKAQRYQLSIGTATIFVHGIIRYVDTFSLCHFTRFRLMVGGNVGIPGDGMARACSEGNETDDDDTITRAG